MKFVVRLAHSCEEDRVRAKDLFEEGGHLSKDPRGVVVALLQQHGRQLQQAHRFGEKSLRLCIAHSPPVRDIQLQLRRRTEKKY